MKILPILFALVPSLALAHPNHEHCALPTSAVIGTASTVVGITEPTLLYFGYTECPIECPLDGSRNLEAVDQAGIGQSLFVSLDPEDDEQDLQWYRENLPGTVTRPQDTDLEDTLSVYAKLTPEGERKMDHQRSTYLVLPGVGIVWVFRSAADVTATEVAEVLRCLVPHETTSEE